jgi:hypothetical protein
MFLTLSKQTTGRFFVATLLRMTLRQVRMTGGKPTTPTFEGGHDEHEVFVGGGFSNRPFVEPFVSIVISCVVR